MPITPIDDRGRSNSYPLFKLVARDAAHNVLAQTNIVLPVSSELNCSSCHASGTGQPRAMPSPGWVYDPNPQHDFRLNALLLHDQRNLTNPVYVAALAQFNYRSTGLYDSVVLDGKSILCAVCHKSEALGTPGAPGTPQLTTSIHSLHATVIDPNTGMTLDDSNNRASCYQCHPGSTTRCLRGAMGCRGFHGGRIDVDAMPELPRLDEPGRIARPHRMARTSQTARAVTPATALGNSGQIRYTSSFDTPGHMRVPTNTRFATNPNTPAAGHIALPLFQRPRRLAMLRLSRLDPCGVSRPPTATTTCKAGRSRVTSESWLNAPPATSRCRARSTADRTECIRRIRRG